MSEFKSRYDLHSFVVIRGLKMLITQICFSSSTSYRCEWITDGVKKEGWFTERELTLWIEQK